MDDDTNNLNYTKMLEDTDEFVIVSNDNQTTTINYKDFKNELKYSTSEITGEKGEKGNIGDYGSKSSVGQKGIKGMPVIVVYLDKKVASVKLVVMEI